MGAQVSVVDEVQAMGAVALAGAKVPVLLAQGAEGAWALGSAVVATEGRDSEGVAVLARKVWAVEVVTAPGKPVTVVEGGWVLVHQAVVGS